MKSIAATRGVDAFAHYRFAIRFAKIRASHFCDSHSNSNFGEGIVNLDGQLQEIIDELLAHGISLELAKKEFEKKYIVGAVKRNSGNLGRAASSLGIHRNTLRNKVGILNIRLPREKFRVSPDITKKK
jgi:DNA-binding NtrC family response regulator